MTIVHLSHKKEGKEKQLKLFKARVHLTFWEDALKVKQKFLLLVSISTFCSANISCHFVGTVFFVLFSLSKTKNFLLFSKKFKAMSTFQSFIILFLIISLRFLAQLNVGVKNPLNEKKRKNYNYYHHHFSTSASWVEFAESMSKKVSAFFTQFHVMTEGNLQVWHKHLFFPSPLCCLALASLKFHLDDDFPHAMKELWCENENDFFFSRFALRDALYAINDS